MSDNNKKNPLGCPQTRGSFALCGIVSGTQSNNFYTEGVTKNKQPYRSVFFTVEVEKGKTIPIRLFGMPQDNVFFSKTDKTTNKTDTQTVPWKDRMTWTREGYRMIGVNCGCKKKIDEKGREKNDTKILTAFDACSEIANLKDGQSVFIRGNISYSMYEGRHQINYEPTQVSLMSPIDFEEKDFAPKANFTQTIVYQGIAKNPDAADEYVVSAKIVGYSSIEDVELFIHNGVLARTFKNSLKPYNSLEVFGDIFVENNINVIEVNNVWGGPNKMKQVDSSTARKLIITGADPDSIEKDNYSEDIIDNALSIIASKKNAKREYGSEDSNNDGNEWGKTSFTIGSVNEDEDDFDIDDDFN